MTIQYKNYATKNANKAKKNAKVVHLTAPVAVLKNKRSQIHEIPARSFHLCVRARDCLFSFFCQRQY